MNKAHASLQHFRHQLANYEALPQLALLGLVCGLGAGLLISLLRIAIDLPLAALLPDHVENFEGLSTSERFLLPVIGSLVLAYLFTLWPLMRCKVGIVHLMERLSYHQGIIPIKHMYAQFISACIALICGHSVGREGPAVYLGACLSSWIGQLLHIPHNSQRLLIACGAAAAISAAFNTPLAGVIFAMEVILLEYTVAGFTPVIVASVSASIVTRVLFDGAPIFDVPSFTVASMSEVPWIIATGAVIGIIAAAFIKLMLLATKSKRWPLQLRFILAGLITGAVAVLYPQVMGTGY
ncbi:MAG: chloride channel protein, partial [Pseudomonadales bacterium]